jgi:hypothetical protein
MTLLVIAEVANPSGVLQIEHITEFHQNVGASNMEILSLGPLVVKPFSTSYDSTMRVGAQAWRSTQRGCRGATHASSYTLKATAPRHAVCVAGSRPDLPMPSRWAQQMRTTRALTSALESTPSSLYCNSASGSTAKAVLKYTWSTRSNGRS